MQLIRYYISSVVLTNNADGTSFRRCQLLDLLRNQGSDSTVAVKVGDTVVPVVTGTLFNAGGGVAGIGGRGFRYTGRIGNSLTGVTWSAADPATFPSPTRVRRRGWAQSTVGAGGSRCLVMARGDARDHQSINAGASVRSLPQVLTDNETDWQAIHNRLRAVKLRDLSTAEQDKLTAAVSFAGKTAGDQDENLDVEFQRLARLFGGPSANYRRLRARLK